MAYLTSVDGTSIAYQRDELAYWPGLEDLTNTLAYDAGLYGPPPTGRWTTITQPSLVATGGSNDYFEEAADAVAASLAHTERQVIAEQGHVVDPEVMAAVLTRLFGT
jgi:hypothetical protein